MTPRAPHFEIFKDTRQDWRWRMRAANGRIIADSGEGYASRFNVRRAIVTFVEAVAGLSADALQVVEVTS